MAFVNGKWEAGEVRRAEPSFAASHHIRVTLHSFPLPWVSPYRGHYAKSGIAESPSRFLEIKKFN